MRRSAHTIILVAASLTLVCVVTFLTQRLWRENGLRALQAVNEPRIQLIASTVKSEINRQDHLPVVLSLDIEVQQALAGPSDLAMRRHLDEKLTRISREADTRALFVIAPSGKIFATDGNDVPESQIGRDLSDRPYFREAIANGKSTFLGVEPSGDRVRYYVANSIRNPALLGVAVVRIQFDGIEADWQKAGERVLVTDAQGTVFLSSDPSFKYRPLKTVGLDPTHDPIAASVHYPGSDAAPIDFEVLEHHGDGQIVRIQTTEGDRSYLYQTMPLPEYGWTIHRLSDLSTVESDQRDGGIIGAAISILVVSGLLYLRHRQQALVAARKAGAELTSEVAKRTRELRIANETLHLEVDERRRTEERLRDTQNSLVQAGKLAALGQMSAAIAHEINQPLAAIRTFIASTKIYSTRGDVAHVSSNLDLINSLAERMANITSHLKTFARKSEPGKTETVDVKRAVQGAMLLIDSQTRLAGATIKLDVPDHLNVRGYAVQLEQVILNLLQNALHAVAETKNPAIQLTVAATEEIVRITVVDNGSGIAKEHLDQIFDPFFTTKAIGRGLGLGLSISYGIVRDFKGEIRAVNRIEGGTEMTLELPRFYPESAMLHA